MKGLKQLARLILERPTVSRRIVILSLYLHNLSYRIAGSFSIHLEPDGLHPKHRLTRYHDWFIRQLKPGWTVLDVGCGNGALAFDLKNHCAFVTAIDINQRLIEYARSQYTDTGIEYVLGDATSYPFNKKYDAIVLSNVLEHIENRIDFLRHLYAHQDQDNPPILLLRVPMLNRDWITLYKKEIGIEWRLDPTHTTEYTVMGLEQELASAGLQIDRYDIQFGEFYGGVKKTRRPS